MTDSPRSTTFFSLPVELRLHIAAYALEQGPLVGLDRFQTLTDGSRSLKLDTRYRSSTNLAIRLVCRQFNIDFTRVAIQKTRFVLRDHASEIMRTQSEAVMRDVRGLVLCSTHGTIAGWDAFPFNRECLHLDELDFVTPLNGATECKALVRMFRQLQNVKQIGFFFDSSIQNPAMGYYRLIGAMLKEDHYQRYDAPNAPNVESTWWSWTLNSDFSGATFVAQPPKPIMKEQEYLLLMKPRIHEVMEQTADMLS